MDNNNISKGISDSFKKLLDLIKKILSMLFGKKEFGDNSPSNTDAIGHNLKGMNDDLLKFRDQMLEKGDVLKAYMAETQRIGVNEFANRIEQKRDLNNIPINDIAEQAMSSIKEKIGDLNDSSVILDALQDYKNHDVKVLQLAHDEVMSFSNGLIDKNAWGPKGVNCISSALGSLSEIAKTNMTRSPLTPAEKAGFVTKEIINEQVERKIEKNQENSNYHEYSK